MVPCGSGVQRPSRRPTRLVSPDEESMMTRGIWRIFLLASLAVGTGPACAQGVAFQFAIGSPDGSPGSGPGQFNRPWSVAIGPDGRIVVADTFNSRIQVFDAAGKFLFTFGREGFAPGEFLAPEGVAVGPDGRIVVADRNNDRIQVFDAAGNFLFTFGSSGLGNG